MDHQMIIVLVILVLAVIGVAAWYFMRQRKSTQLRGRFGPEYEDAVRRHGDRARAETDLERRAKRVERFEIRPLSEESREHFAGAWKRNQANFVDDPASSITEADNLVCEAMKMRGYPMGEFELRAEDLSVDHPHVVRNYRAAHEIAMRHSRGETTTEDLRRALIHYRELFAELLQPQHVRQEVHR